jgi:sugar porter (SP) family MFS transporter
MYIGELAPSSHRGRLVALFQFNVVLGILIAYYSNYLLQDVGDHAWRWMLGVQAFPSLFFLIAILFIPESPRWLIINKGDIEAAEAIFSEIDPVTSKSEVESIIQSQKTEVNLSDESITSKRYRVPVTLAFLMAFFNQMSGINAVIYYAPRIFEMASLGKNSALLSTTGIGLVNLIFTMIGLAVIDRFGRRKLMLVGSIGLILSLGLVSLSFYESDFSGYAVPAYLFCFIAFFALSQGAVIWVFISEIFPNKMRAKGQSFGSFTHWLLAAIVAFSFPYITEVLGGGNSFLVFTAMMILQLIFVLRLMPETSGRSLEDAVVTGKQEPNVEPLILSK